jgi:hypothetical protein
LGSELQEKSSYLTENWKADSCIIRFLKAQVRNHLDLLPFFTAFWS